jgi:tRNA C32,U32 (ribose-2'-O)-methylase TrmJ
MKNFGLDDLLLIDPPELEPEGEAYGFAGHARQDVLPGAEEITFDDLCANYHTVGSPRLRARTAESTSASLTARPRT